MARSSSVAPPRDDVVHDTSPRPPEAGQDLTRCGLSPAPFLKEHGFTPSLQFLINVSHCQQAVFPPTRTSQWLFGDWGRAGRGAGEPGPASEAASLAGSPPRGPR